MPTNLKEVNLEAGMPTTDTAIKRVTWEIHNAKSLGYTAVKFIHGYGSSGKGGKIRVEARAYLQRQKARGVVKKVIEGERFTIFDEDTRAAFMVCDDLRRDHDLERSNNGVTFVVL